LPPDAVEVQESLAASIPSRTIEDKRAEYAEQIVSALGRQLG
jgi:hypothetical protein